MKRVAAGGFVAALAMAWASIIVPTATAEPPHGEGGHSHYVINGNGECVAIDHVQFHGGDRGLHHGGRQSGQIGHGPCPSE